MQEYKTIKFEVKSFDEATGEFEGIASAYRKTPDKVGDIVTPGAFTKTIQENDGEIMLTFPPHDTRSPVGKGQLIDTPDGLSIKGTLIRGIQKAEEAYLLMKAGVVKTLSIGYDVIKSDVKGGIRYLREISLGEIGLVPGKLAADDMAIITGVKTLETRIDELETEIKSGRVLSKNNMDRVRKAIEALDELLKASESEADEEKDETGEDGGKSLALPAEQEPHSTPASDGAARLDAAISKFKSFDDKKAGARIDEILEKIRRK
ncbi:MAG: HK97 family phage prohead protease [Anaerovoracaceae bacterium]